MKHGLAAATADTVAVAPVVADQRLAAHLPLVAKAERLLVATDFDGTLVGFRDDPQDVWLSDEGSDILTRLTRCRDTVVAVLSGRSLADLRQRLGGVPGLLLVGSHGAERSDGVPLTLDADRAALLATTTRQLEAIARGCPGTWVETKPASAVFHYRTADPAIVPDAVARVLDGPAAQPLLHRRLGKDCIELAVSRSTKGHALAELRSRHAVDRVVFLGDDVTDEDGFLVLAFQDIGIKVGPGATAAEHRVDAPADALAVLGELARLREARSSATLSTSGTGDHAGVEPA